MAVTAILTLFFLNEKIDREQTELADFFIENYLNENTTYEIADHSDYYFETSSFIKKMSTWLEKTLWKQDYTGKPERI